MISLVSIAIVVLSIALSPWGVSAVPGRHVCVVEPMGDEKNDVPNILKAFEECNVGGIIRFPRGESTGLMNA
jgi:hypothetical protein